MDSPLVVFIPQAERRALREGGVLPPPLFCDVGSAGWDDGGTCIRLWKNELNRDAEDDGGVPPHPARLLGLSNATDSSLSNEDLVAKLFGACVLHIVFLDEADDSEGTAGSVRSRRDVTRDWVGVDPVLKRARWVRLFDQAVKYWYSDEQARHIRHIVLVVARGGRVRLSKDQLETLRAEFSETGTLRTCYFLDFRLEIETGNDALHSKCLWPVLAGRLLLRLLIALESGRDDDVFCPGVHLWRSYEFLFDYPVEDMTKMLRKALDEAYARLARETDASGGGGKPFPEIRNEETRTFPAMKTALTQFGRESLPRVRDCRMSLWSAIKSLWSAITFKRKKPVDPDESECVDWHVYPAASLVAERTGDDERRWGGRIAKARAEFAAMESELFRGGDPALADFSPDGVFPSVGLDPRNVSLQLRRIDAENPGDTTNGNDIYREWLKVVAAEKARQSAKDELRRAADELALAQGHYVTARWGMVVAIIVSLFCGLALVRSIWALGGNGALPIAFFFASLSVVGAFVAWGIVSFLHRRAGRAAAAQFAGIAEAVDDRMDDRHGAAVTTVKAAETRHRRMLRFDNWFALSRLLRRVWRILSRELQSPTLTAFYRTDTDDADSTMPDAADLETRRQRAVFLDRTRISESLRDMPFGLDRHERSDLVLSETLEQTGAGSFRAFWSGLCSSMDVWNQGNLPAKVLVPAIRAWLANLCNRLSAAQKTDLLESRGGRGVLPSGFEKLRSISGFSLATAHVDVENAAAWPARVFVFKEPRDLVGGHPVLDVKKQALKLLKGAWLETVSVSETSVLNGLPQVAFCFQDIRLFGLGREEDGRMNFLLGPESEIVGKGGSR